MIRCPLAMGVNVTLNQICAAIRKGVGGQIPQFTGRLTDSP